MSAEQGFTSGCIFKAKWTKFPSGLGDRGSERSKDRHPIFLLSTRKDRVVLPGHGAEGLESDSHSHGPPDIELEISAGEQDTNI